MRGFVVHRNFSSAVGPLNFEAHSQGFPRATGNFVNHETSLSFNQISCFTLFGGDLSEMNHVALVAQQDDWQGHVVAVVVLLAHRAVVDRGLHLNGIIKLLIQIRRLSLKLPVVAASAAAEIGHPKCAV